MGRRGSSTVGVVIEEASEMHRFRDVWMLQMLGREMRMVDAQQARRVLDRLVGYKISPILWDKVRRGLSAGRVQSVALEIICDREREIEAFVPEEYWHITARLAAELPPEFEALVLSCLAKDPDERPASAEWLAARLANLRCDFTIYQPADLPMALERHATHLVKQILRATNEVVLSS